MMIEKVRIKNYQSLKDVEVDLAPFTVILGASDSGKSAFFRALQTLVSNRRGTDFITHGQKLCEISATTEEGQLTLQRGKGTNDNFYEIELNDRSDSVKFTKLSGMVPEEVSAFLKIPAKDPINFANQFDKPYLLDSKEFGPSEVARILGALTNVNILFEGARESNKQKTSVSSELKIRNADVESIQQELSSYEGLEERDSKLKLLEETLQKLEADSSMLGELEEVISLVPQAEALAKQHEMLASAYIPDISDIETLCGSYIELSSVVHSISRETAIAEDSKKELSSSLPDIVLLEKQISMLSSLESAISSAKELETSLLNWVVQRETVEEEIERLQSEHQSILEQEGVCPTCGQEI